MDTYRRLHGPFPPCESVRYLKRLYEAAYPRLPCNEADCSIEELTRQERAMFISQKDVEEILREQVGGKSAVDIILECICDHCTKLRTQDTYGTTELARLATDILKHCRVLFATLIYLGFSQLIGGLRGGFLAQPPLIQDSNLDAMGEWLKQNKRNYPLLPRGFEESYFVALKLFTAPIFELQSKFHHADDCRFPFLDESMHAEGSFGTVRKFNIHPHFIGKDVRRLETLGPAIFGYEKALKNGSKIPHVFARKTLKMEKGSRFDGKMKMEYDTLLVISAMRCKNIVQLVSFYTWRQEINFIFPFVEGNLEKLLRGEWSPTGLPSGPQQMPYHWLWKQMIGVADALHWIHEPTVPENLKGRLRGSKIIAFHLDLKPANILISRDAILQITDFGQSMIKMVPQGTSEYGIYIGGDQAYQPPESSVSRGGVNRLSFITNEIPLDHARSASSAPFKIEDLHESLKIDSNFDVWSLACIMVEVLVYISKNGKDGFLEFERTRQAEMPAVPFHKNGENGEKFLKECVELTLERLGNGNIAWATPNSSNEPQLLYMDALTTLIAEMFKVDPKLRPDSWKVAQKLKDLDTEFNDNNGILLSKLDNALEKEGTPEDFMS